MSSTHSDHDGFVSGGAELDLIVLPPPGAPHPPLAIAGSRAGALGVLDLQADVETGRLEDALERTARLARGRWGVLAEATPQTGGLLEASARAGAGAAIVEGCGDPAALFASVAAARAAGLSPLVVARSVGAARRAEEAGAAAVLAKGHEAGGWVGEEGSFVLLQRCVRELSVPVYAYGGVGLHTVAACVVAGARGAVLDGQLLLAQESPLPDVARRWVAGMDGSEAVSVGAALGAPLRMLLRPDLPGPVELRRTAERLEADDAGDASAAWRAAVAERLSWDGRPGSVLAAGQDAAFAADLARRFVTVGGIVAAVRETAAAQLALVREHSPLAPDAGWAAGHGTAHPIAQGPMTRVSDRAEFAATVAEAGALPFLALALLRGPEVAELLRGTRDELGDRPWGVGILGFVPAELRAEQLDVVRALRPPFALIAGGRPDQARALEEDGTATYLHAPSPALLRLYLRDGARRFVFEGRECGGHVGPRTSFVLWEAMVRTLLEELPRAGGEEVSVLFAGGIHDDLSAAMAAAIAAPLAQRGVQVGVLMGTAYLFTQEVVAHGAITEAFQRAAVEGDGTVLLESGPGHATRCLPSPFVDEFGAQRRRLLAEDLGPAERRDRLEELNIGRLRIAAKGADRNPAYGTEPEAPKLIALDEDEQWRQGLFMIGQVAALHDRVGTVAELHEAVTAGSAARLAALPAVEPEPEPAPEPVDIAIVGVGAILPGARDARQFWDNVVEGVDAVTEIPPERWDWRRHFDEDRAAPDRVYSRWGGFVDDVEFDPLRFGMPPNTLRSIEPFQLLGLLAAQAALEDAGYGERPFPRERTSVMFGAGGGGADLAVGYTVRSALPSLLGDDGHRLVGDLGDRLPEWTEDSFPGLLMNVVAGRIANRLDLGGANFTVDAACGSSLAAITLAVRDLQNGMSDMAVVGGVDAIQNPFAYLCFAKTQALSPNGRCRPFDAAADGIAISEGFAAVILKRLADAERDGDRVYAVIRGVGAASDGRDRSLTAPRPAGQMRALRRAYAHAGISPSTVGLVEAHGTGTVAGDRAEIEALQTIFDAAGAARQGCAIGSVKSMIGHTKATAGVAGLVKAALALHHRVLPPTLGVATPNPRADFPATPFYVNSEARPWVHAGDDAPRRAAVSAFGFGGTNFHVVLEEYTGGFLPAADAGLDRWPAELLVWRRDTAEELAEALDALTAALRQGAQPALADLALTLAEEAAAGEPARPTLAIVADSVPDLQAKLDTARALLREGGARTHAANGVHLSREPLAADGRVAFLFPGQGSQVVDMGREIAVVFPEARACLDRADRVLAGRHDRPLSRFVFPPPAFTDEERKARQGELTETDVAQPALGAVELAYLHVLRAVGVEPELAAGHSYGEFVALAAAGSLSEDDLLRLSEARGRFIREEAGEESGAMAAIDAGPEALAELAADGDIVLANLNGPQQTVVSGSRAAVERALAWCGEHDLRARRLPVACAFHSPLVAPAQRRLAALLGETDVAVPRIPVFSNTTAARYPDDPEAITATLAEHLVEPVAFADEIVAMHEAGARLFLEAGPRNVLTGLVGRVLGDRPHVAVAVDQTGRPGHVQLLHALAALASEGVAVRVERLFRGRSAEPLDMRTLEPVAGRPARSPATWLVNGGRARPASEPVTPNPIPRLQLDEVTMTHTNGAHGDGGGDEGLVAAAPAAPPPAQPAVRGAPRDERVGEVIGRHHQVMQRFLETQKSVMLAYLGQGRAAAGREAPAPAVPQARPALPEPASVPVTPAPPPAPAPAPAALATTAAAAAAPRPPAQLDIAALLLEVVSERTGYPPDMLDIDADLESDLGVDSIKRVEIAGTMTQQMRLPVDVELDVEELTASRTLRQVVAVLEGLAGTTGQPRGEPVPFELEPVGGRIGRFVLQAAGAPAVTERAGLAGDGVVVVVDDATGVGEELAQRLGRGGHRAELVPAPDAGAVAPLLGELRRHGGRVKALVHLAALAPAAQPDLAGLLVLAQGLRDDLEASAADGGAAIVGVTRMGGTFGVDGDADRLDPAQGVVPGFLKSLAQEWPAVRVKAVDIVPGAPADVARRVLDELLAADGILEVGLRGEVRTTLRLAPVGLEDREPVQPLDAASVVLITGGARGITAEAAVALAARYRPTLVLVGRTPLTDEGEATAGPTDPRELQQAIMERRRRDGEALTPRLVGQEVHRILAGQEVRATVDRIRAAGARVEYRTCDVQDTAALEALVDDVYATHGRIDGVVHGAGVIEDRLVRDKELASARRVLATKAVAARTLAERLRPETLRFLVFFSSVSGRFGNRGQADYAAASEVLNKLAQQLDRRWEARVLSVNWGPWATAGMVSPQVARQFAQRGVAMVSVEEGCRRLDEELRMGRKGEVEVLIGGMQDRPGAPAVSPGGAFLQAPSAVIRREAGRVEVIRRLEPEHDRLLDDHRLDGVPVLPFAGAMELMAQTAATAHPELEVVEVRDIGVNQGVRLDEASLAVSVVAVPSTARAGAGTTAMDVTIDTAATDRPRYRSTVVLAERLDAGPRDAPVPAFEGLAPFPMTVAEAYAEYLFHGPLFQGIEAIEGIGEQGAVAALRGSDPARCLHGVAPGTTWVLDPVLIDCALQMQVLWCRVHWGVTLLPARIAGYRRLAPPPGPAVVRHELRVQPSSRAPMCTVDHRFYGPDALLATLTGVTGVGSEALNRLAKAQA